MNDSCHDKVVLRKVSNHLRTDLAQHDLIMKEYAGFLERYGGRMDGYLYRALASLMTDFYLVAESMFATNFLVFRHVIPQAYGTSFDERKLAALEKFFETTSEMLSREMNAFCAHLEKREG